MEALMQSVFAGLIISALTLWITLLLTKKTEPTRRATIVFVAIAVLCVGTSLRSGPERVLVYCAVGIAVFVIAYLRHLGPAIRTARQSGSADHTT